MPLYKWSQTAASNASADSSINWAEGQPPSSVNDSARAMMAVIAKYRDDISGAIQTSGTSTAYTVTSFSDFDTLAHLDSQIICFTPHATNDATVTLNVDGLGAKPLRSAPSTELPAGVLVEGTPYVALYNNTDSAFYLQGFFGNPYNVPIASGLDYWGSSAPNSSFAFPYGQAISRTTYATCYAKMGTTYGSGDGSTTFNLPDKRSRVSVAPDNMGGTASNRITFAFQGFDPTVLGASGGVQSVTLTTTTMPSHSHANTLTDPGHAHTYTAPSQNPGGVTGGGSQGAIVAGSASTTSNFTGISITNVSTGGGGAHQNLQPSIICNYIIRIL